MQERDNQLKVQLQLRDEYMDAELKRRYQNMEEVLRLRDEEWKSRWEIKERELSEELKAREDAFGYLHKEHHKEIRLLIEKRDKELEGTLNYRGKCWNESLDMINNNLLKMYSA